MRYNWLRNTRQAPRRRLSNMAITENLLSDDGPIPAQQPPAQGAYIVLAGPGTGKTTLLTARALYVMQSTPGQRSKILALTFTNRAAAEMRSRLRVHGDQFASRLFIGTFHSFATHVLRSHGDAIGLDTGFVIFDQDDQRSVLQDLRDEGELSQGVNIDSVVSTFSRLKSRGVSLSDPQTDGQSRAFASLAVIHTKYRARLAWSNALDFGDLITECLRLFAENPRLGDLYRTAYPYVLVDEFQDTTPAQFDLLKAIITPAAANVFAVADEDQLIFEWNEARLETLNLYLEQFKAEVTYSTLSHRCPPAVVDAANAIIANNRLRLQTKPAIQTQLREQGTVFVHEAEDEKSEANFVAAKIKELHRSGIPLSEIAVMGRNRRCLQSVGLALNAVHIPAGQPSTAGLGDDEDGEVILRLLRWLQNPRDEQSARRVTQYLKPSLSDLFDESVRSGLREGVPLEVALADTPDAARGDQIRELLAHLSQWRLLSRDTGRLITSLSNDLPRLLEDSDRAAGVLTVLQAMETLLREVSNATHTRLADFLAGLPVVVGTRAHGGTNQSGAVSILTFHQAKGLEFTSVFLIGLADGVFPDFRSATRARALEEERRLFYVGLTRTRRDVFLTFARSRRAMTGRTILCEESRFIEEIPGHLLTYI